MNATNILQLICLILMLLGWLSLLIPGIPGIVIIWGVALGYALLSGAPLTWLNASLFLIFTVLMVIGGLIDNVIMGAAATSQGAHWLAALGALALGVLASLFLTPLGGLLAAFVSLFLIEFIRLRDWRKALKSTGGMAIGYGGSIAARLAIGLVMIVMWGMWARWLT